LEVAKLILIDYWADEREAVPLLEQTSQEFFLVSLFSLFEALLEVVIRRELNAVLVDHLQGEVSQDPEELGLRDRFVQ